MVTNVFAICLVIALKLGEFHKMDRQRAPTFIKFIIQRIFLLVSKTNLSKNFGTNMIVDSCVFSEINFSCR